MRQDEAMSKKINSALKDLKKALSAHADVVGGSAVSLKKAQRASAKVAAAAESYAEAVLAKSGLATPFSVSTSAGLEEATLASLTAERNSIKENLTGPVPVQEPASHALQEPELADSPNDSHTDQHEPEPVENPTRSSTD